MAPTVSEVNQKRADVAALSREQLAGKTVAALRALAKGVLPKVSGLRKVELVNQLIEATQSERGVLEVAAARPQYVRRLSEENVGLSELAEKHFSELKRIVVEGKIGRWSESKVNAELAAQSNRIVYDLEHREGRQAGGGQSLTTILSSRTDLFNAIRADVDAYEGRYQQYLKECLDFLKTAVESAQRDMGKRKNEVYRARVEVRDYSRTVVDISELYKMTGLFLGELEAMPASAWWKVVLALTFATGRRPAELQSTARFEVVDRHTVKFTGQSKVKGAAAAFYEKNPSYLIPTLIPAETCVQALRWLTDKKKVVDSPSAAHKRYSSDLSARFKTVREIQGLPQNFIPYSLRACYAQIACQLAGLDSAAMQGKVYIAQILGHSRSRLTGSDAVTADRETAESYTGDWLLKNIPDFSDAASFKGFEYHPWFEQMTKAELMSALAY